MTRMCPELERFESAAAPSERERRRWMEHLWSCRSCQQEWIARSELAELISACAPARLPDDFERRLQARLQQTAAPRKLRPEARRWLALYWTAAVLASAYILHVLRWLDWALAAKGLVVVALLFPFLELIPARTVRRLVLLFDAPERPRRIPRTVA